ncbi:hypothetical protein [Brevundimonas sp.]|uniref:hypothetical protein n=1 Tax=Brevundimonas sp. TaxID=1871086 RepID=UPI003F70FA1E
MSRPLRRVTRQPVLASFLSVIAACVGGTGGFLLTAGLRSGDSTPLIMAMPMALLFSPVGILIGALPATGLLLVLVWPSLLLFNRGLGLTGRAAVGLVWLLFMGLLGLLALMPSGGEQPSWQFMLTPLFGISFGAMVMACFAQGAADAELDIAWQQD